MTPSASPFRCRLANGRLIYSRHSDDGGGSFRGLKMADTTQELMICTPSVGLGDGTGVVFEGFARQVCGHAARVAAP
jgi:hypothetical protein